MCYNENDDMMTDKDYQYEYWEIVKEKAIMHPKMKALLDEVYSSVRDEGLKPVLKRKRLLNLYHKFIDEKNKLALSIDKC